MSEPVCAQKSPYVLELKPGTYYWCACGKSADQPFCDGSHAGTGFSPVELDLTEKTTVGFCGCKRTKDVSGVMPTADSISRNSTRSR